VNIAATFGINYDIYQGINGNTLLVNRLAGQMNILPAQIVIMNTQSGSVLINFALLPTNSFPDPVSGSAGVVPTD